MSMKLIYMLYLLLIEITIIKIATEYKLCVREQSRRCYVRYKIYYLKKPGHDFFILTRRGPLTPSILHPTGDHNGPYVKKKFTCQRRRRNNDGLVKMRLTFARKIHFEIIIIMTALYILYTY